MQQQTDYELAVKTKYPEQIVIAIARDENGKANPVTIGWTMIASGDPPMMAIALATKRYSAHAIRHSKCFTIAFPSADMAAAALFFGSNSGADIDKLANCDCKTQPAEKIDSVLLADAVANFECTLESETVAGDHIIFIGRIVCSHINTAPKDRLYTVAEGHKLGSVSAD